MITREQLLRWKVGLQEQRAATLSALDQIQGGLNLIEQMLAQEAEPNGPKEEGDVREGKEQDACEAEPAPASAERVSEQDDEKRDGQGTTPAG